jgi:hypothetical protein
MERERDSRVSRIHTGYGIGRFFGKLMRNALLLFQTCGKFIVEKTANIGMKTIHHIASGVSPRHALQQSILDVSDEILDDVKREIRRKVTEWF